MNYQTNEKPNQNYLTLAVISMILGCCSFMGVGFILGVVALVFATQVNKKSETGDIEGAYKAAGYARTLSIAALLTMVLSLGYQVYDYKTHPEKYEKIMELYQQKMEEIEQQQQTE